MKKVKVKGTMSNEWYDMEFLAWGIESENVDGIATIYTTAICMDNEGYVEVVGLPRLKFETPPPSEEGA